jgi:hypothetical protein
MDNDKRQSDPRYKKWRKAVLKRDGNKCMMPGCKSRYKLQAHHIQRWADAFHLRFEVENGISLCKSCHYMIRNKEHCYASLFNSIVQGGNNK